MNCTSMLGAALALAWTASSVAMAREAPTMTVAVVDFTNDTSSASWWNGDVGRQLADVLSNELSATGDFKVIERQKIDAVLAEQDLAASSRMRPGSSPHTGGLDVAGFRVGGDFSHSKKTPASKAVRTALIEAADHLDCTMVERDGCEARCQQKEQRRRNGSKNTLDLD